MIENARNEPDTNLVVVETGGSRSREIGRFPDLESAKDAARQAAGAGVAFTRDAEYGGWRCRAGQRVLRILEPGAASRLLEMADTDASGGTVDLEMDQDPPRPEEG